MSDTPQAQSPKRQPLRIERASNFRLEFANHTRLRVAPGEFGLVFGFTDETPTGPLTEEKVSIVLTPYVAKLLSTALKAALATYERQYGSITKLVNTPTDAQELYQAIEEAVNGLLERQ